GVAHKRLAVDKLNVLRRDGRHPECDTVLHLRGNGRLGLCRRAGGLQSCFHEGRGTLGNCPCQTMGTPTARRLGTLWAWASILHAIDGTLLLWISHLHGAVEQGLHLPGEEQLDRPLNAVVTLG